LTICLYWWECIEL